MCLVNSSTAPPICDILHFNTPDDLIKAKRQSAMAAKKNAAANPSAPRPRNQRGQVRIIENMIPVEWASMTVFVCVFACECVCMYVNVCICVLTCLISCMYLCAREGVCVRIFVLLQSACVSLFVCLSVSPSICVSCVTRCLDYVIVTLFG